MMFTMGRPASKKRPASPSDPLGGEDAYLVPALTRGIRLLSLFSRDQPELSGAEITRRLRLPHATVFRLLRTLETFSLLRRTATGFALGPRILTLGYDYLSAQSLPEVARPVLEELRDATNTTANMGVLDGTEVIYVGHVPSRRPLATRMQVGSRFPAHASSIGRLLLGALNPAELAELYRGVSLAEPGGEAPTSLPALEATIATDSERGYVISRGFYERSLIAVAAPVYDHTGTVVAGVNISGLADSFSFDELKGQTKDHVVNAARAISQRLGFTGRPA
jgi:DNA-binding IclR family transcriptional regulator